MIGGEINVEVLECTVKECRHSGVCVTGGATVVATRCEFIENRSGAGACAEDPNTKVRLNECTTHHNHFGLFASDYAAIGLYGENTDIHSNTSHGIVASRHGKVQIHLPSQHNTSHGNRMQDRHTLGQWHHHQRQMSKIKLYLFIFHVYVIIPIHTYIQCNLFSQHTPGRVCACCCILPPPPPICTHFFVSLFLNRSCRQHRRSHQIAVSRLQLSDFLLSLFQLCKHDFIITVLILHQQLSFHLFNTQ